MYDNLEYIGREIKRIRKSQNLSQKKLAELAGLSEESLRRIENNYNNPRLDNLTDIFRVLGINFDIILMREEGSYWEDVDEKIKVIDYELSNTNYDNILKYTDELMELKSSLPQKYRLRLSQYILYYQAVYDNEVIYDELACKEKLIRALEINNCKLENNNFNDIEIRILTKLSEYYINNEDDDDIPRKILDTLIRTVDKRNTHYINILYNKARLYYMIGDYKNTIAVSLEAIKISSEINNYNRLIIIYYIIGISKYKLGENDYIDYIEKSKILCDLMLKDKLKETIETSVYNITNAKR